MRGRTAARGGDAGVVVSQLSHSTAKLLRLARLGVPPLARLEQRHCPALHLASAVLLRLPPLLSGHRIGPPYFSGFQVRICQFCQFCTKCNSDIVLPPIPFFLQRSSHLLLFKGHVYISRARSSCAAAVRASVQGPFPSSKSSTCLGHPLAPRSAQLPPVQIAARWRAGHDAYINRRLHHDAHRCHCRSCFVSQLEQLFLFSINATNAPTACAGRPSCAGPPPA